MQTPNHSTHEAADVEIARLTRRLNRERAARKEAELIAESATKVAIEDPLTHLANRTLILATLERELARAKRRHSHVAVLFVDLDRFKQVNDTHGHETGDSVLIVVAEALRATVRAGDSIGRLGGDEFVVIAPDIEEDTAQRLADRLVAAIESNHTTDIAKGTRISASVGISLHSGDESADEALNRADLAMYVAKQQQLNWHIYDTRLQHRDEQQRSIRQRLPAAIRNREFSVSYQPIFSLPDREVMLFESLLRWPQFGNDFFPTDDIIQAAQEAGQIEALGSYVLETVAQQTRQIAQSVEIPLPPITINVSPQELARKGYAADFFDLLNSNELPANALIIEITESALLKSCATVDSNLHALRERGVLLALDDFGTGYSSLGRLRNHHFDIVKVDSSFVANIVDNRYDRAIVLAIVAMANALGTPVIAEGVETAEQFDAVCALGCHAAQGWFFSDVMTAEALTGFIDHNGIGTC